MAESEEELKSLLMKVKEKCEKAGLKLKIQKPKIMASSPITSWEIKAKISKWDLIKIKSFCKTKGTKSKVKRQPSEWEKIIANEATDKELISKIYKQHLQLNSKRCLLLGRKAMKNLNSVLKRRDITL